MVSRYAIIDNGAVINIVLADESYAMEMGWIHAANAAIGDIWDGDIFIKPDPVVDPPPPPDYSAIVANSYSTRLTARAAKLDKRGDSFGAAQLLIKASEVRTNG